MPLQKHKYAPTIAMKLVIAVGLLMSGVGLVFSIVIYRYEEGIFRDNLIHYARFSSELVTRGLRRGMLEGRREGIAEGIDHMAASAEISSIRIFRNDGTLALEAGHQPEGAPPPGGTARGERSEFVSTPDGERLLRYTAPIAAEAACSSAQCHAHPAEATVLGSLEITLPATSVLSQSRRMLYGTFVFGALYTAIISAAIFIILYKIVTRPLGIMSEGMRRLASGDFDHPIEIRTGDEMEALAGTFNSMTSEIGRARRKLEDWAEELGREVASKTEEIRAAQDHLVDAEKLASLGRMAAGVAHELNNPLTGILSFAHIIRSRMTPDRAEDIEDLTLIIQQTERCAQIIKGLLGFARKGSAEKMPVNMNDLIASTVTILRSQARFQNVRFDLDLTPALPTAVLDPNQMQQVIINLLTNATDAMDERGAINVTTRHLAGPEGGSIEVEVADTGPGIMPDLLGKIFEPFFTTKPVGKGTGLGLPVSYGIVKRHGGEIVVRSAIGKGTTFRITLPVTQAAAPTEEKPHA